MNCIVTHHERNATSIVSALVGLATSIVSALVGLATSIVSALVGLATSIVSALFTLTASIVSAIIVAGYLMERRSSFSLAGVLLFCIGLFLGKLC